MMCVLLSSPAALMITDFEIMLARGGDSIVDEFSLVYLRNYRKIFVIHTDDVIFDRCVADFDPVIFNFV